MMRCSRRSANNPVEAGWGTCPVSLLVVTRAAGTVDAIPSCSEAQVIPASYYTDVTIQGAFPIARVETRYSAFSTNVFVPTL